MYDTLIVQVHKAFEYLTNVNSNEILGELSKTFAYVVQGSVFAESTKGSQPRADRGTAYVLKDDVQVLPCLDESFVLDDIGMLELVSHMAEHVRQGTYIEILEQVDLRL